MDSSGVGYENGYETSGSMKCVNFFVGGNITFQRTPVHGKLTNKQKVHIRDELYVQDVLCTIQGR